MQNTNVHTLTSDRIFLLTYFFWMFAGCLLIFPVILTVMSGSELFASRYQETPELFISGALIPFAKQLLILIIALVVAILAFRAGLRDREVVLSGDGTVQIRWGRRVPLTLRRIVATSLKDFVVEKEARFAVNARSSSGQFGLSNRPDRWRLAAKADGRKVNLGSYTTEKDAQTAIALIQKI